MANFERKKNDGPRGVHLAIRLELLAGIRGNIGSSTGFGSGRCTSAAWAFAAKWRRAAQGSGSFICNRRARPSLLDQKGQVVYPIVFTYPAGINHMRQIVHGVRDNKVGVRNGIVAGNRSCSRSGPEGRGGSSGLQIGGPQRQGVGQHVYQYPWGFHSPPLAPILASPICASDASRRERSPEYRAGSPCFTRHLQGVNSESI